MAYIGRQQDGFGVRSRFIYTATGGQTTFTTDDSSNALSYSDGAYVDVYLNGVLLDPSDYTATSLTSIVLDSGASADDVLEVIVYDIFSVFSGTFTNGITASEATVTGDLTVDTNTLFVDASANAVGIGTDAPSVNLHIKDTDNNTQIRVENNDGLAKFQKFEDDLIVTNTDTGNILIKTGTGETTALTIDASQNVGIGTSSPLNKLDLAEAGDTQLRITSTDGNNVRLGLNSSGTVYNWIEANGTNLLFAVGNAESMRLDSSGRLGIGTTSPAIYGVDNADDLVIGQGDGNHGITISSFNTSNGTLAFSDTTNATVGRGFVDYDHNVDAMSFGTLSTERMRIDSSGNVGIGTSSVNSPSGGRQVLEINGSSTALFHLSIGGSAKGQLYHSGSEFRINSIGTDPMTFYANGSERMRIDSSGDIMAGTTSEVQADSSGTGLYYDVSKGTLQLKASGNVPIVANRVGSDGVIAQFRKDGTTVGFINSRSGLVSSIVLDPRNGGAGLSASGQAILPTSQTGATNNDIIDLGDANSSFDNIFAANGTIQTSDQTMKQDIASLTSAEINAAKAISKLFKTFKWKSRVTSKGDAARTHIGVMAQEVQSAMTDAGLDATKYSFFCSNTWWESDGETYDTQADAPEGATERTRLGIRYPELLAFVGAATEQRLADIETRLTTLENA